MKRSGFKRKTYEEVMAELKAKPPKPRKGISRRTALKARGSSDSSLIKEQIQATARLAVTIRDGGCILRNLRGCGGVAHVEGDKVISEPGVVIQAEHLITRANAATYADLRVIVCICKRCHGWKHWNKDEYDDLVKSILPKDRVQLWERCEEARKAHRTTRTGSYDWKMQLVGVQLQLADLREKHENKSK